MTILVAVILLSGCLRDDPDPEIDWASVRIRTTTSSSTSTTASTVVVATSSSIIGTTTSSTSTTASTTSTTSTTIKRCLRNGPNCYSIENIRVKLSNILPKKIEVQSRLRMCQNGGECIVVNDCCGPLFGNKYAINHQFESAWKADLSVLCSKPEYQTGCGWKGPDPGQARCIDGYCELVYGGFVD